MNLILTESAKSRLAFHRVRPAVARSMRETVPSRFEPMSDADVDAAVDAAFRLCQRAELVFLDELRFVCLLSTLFGHRFHLAPRYTPVTEILFDPAQTARMRRTKPMVASLVHQVWGDQQQRDTLLDVLTTQLRTVTE